MTDSGFVLDRPETPPEQPNEVQAMAHELATGAVQVELLDRVHDDLEATPAERRYAFIESFARHVGANEARRRAWSLALTEALATAMTDADATLSLPRFDRKALQRESQAWSQATNPCKVWERWTPFQAREQLYFYLQLLLEIDPAAWCEAMDGFSTPGLMIGVLTKWYRPLGWDRDGIAALLRVAPAVFDSRGHWVESRSIVALVVAWTIVEHAQTMWRAESARGTPGDRGGGETDEQLELQAREATAWMGEAYGILLERSDGKYIAIHMLARLARNELIRDRRYHSDDFWLAERSALEILAGVLESAGAAVGEVREAWRTATMMDEASPAAAGQTPGRRRPGTDRIAEDEGEGARTLRGEGMPFLLGAALILAEQPSHPEVEAFSAWFDELLVGQDPGLRLVEHGTLSQELLDRFGFLLSRMSDPSAVFRESYIKLEPQRRRAQFWPRYEGIDHDLGSLLLLRVGLYAASHCHHSATGSEEAEPVHTLFWWIYDAARRLWLTSGYLLCDRDRQELVCACFAFLPSLFGDQLPDALRRAVPPIDNEPWMASMAGWFLWKNGVSADRIAPLLQDAGIDLVAALRDTRQWATLRGAGPLHRDSGRPDPDFPPSLEELARALDVSLEDEPVEVPSHEVERAHLREQLVRSVPFGAALLGRLDEDGCSLRHVVSMDARGTTWLLQVAVPTALQELFGLSAEARVLVVHGQVRGRDLRIATQEPTGAADVDLDLLVVASDQPALGKRLPMLAGPWGQRIAWPPVEGLFAPLAETLGDRLPGFDLFDYRDPVRGSALVGRRAYRDDLAARMLRGEAVGIIGLRKVGKSSLIRAVAEAIDPIGARRGMFELFQVPVPEIEPEALVVSLDVQGLARRPLAVLLERLCVALQARVAPAARERFSPAASEGALLETLQGLIRLAIDRIALPVCFVFDEYDLLFEGYSGEPGIVGVERLLALIRAEAQATGRVSLAMIGRDPAFLERPLLGGFTNPLAGWARPLFLGPLERAEADELLIRLGKRVGLDVGPETLEASWSWTGGHPLLVRQYGAGLFELAGGQVAGSRPLATDPLHDAAVERFLCRDAVHTITAEVLALLEARFPEALTLLEALADAPPEHAGAIVERHGGPRAPGITTLLRFGIASGAPGLPELPRVYRDEFAGYRSIVVRTVSHAP